MEENLDKTVKTGNTENIRPDESGTAAADTNGGYVIPVENTADKSDTATADTIAESGISAACTTDESGIAVSEAADGAGIAALKTADESGIAYTYTADTPAGESVSEASAVTAPSVKALRRSVNHIFFWLLLYNLFTYVAAGLLDLIFEGVDVYTLTMITTVSGTALVYLCTFRRWPARPFLKSRKRMTGKDFATVLGVFGISQIITLAVGIITDSMGIEGTSLELGEMTLSLAVYAALLGPFVEEMMFRGFAIGSGRNLGRIPSIVLASAAFGLMHGNLIQLVIGFIGGLVLGFVFSEYSIWWALLIHIINNSLGIVSELVPAEISDLVTAGFYLIYALFAVYAVIQIIKRRDEVKAWFEDKDNHGPAGVTRSILTSPWFIIFAVLYLAIIVFFMVFPEFASIASGNLKS